MDNVIFLWSIWFEVDGMEGREEEEIFIIKYTTITKPYSTNWGQLHGSTFAIIFY